MRRARRCPLVPAAIGYVLLPALRAQSFTHADFANAEQLQLLGHATVTGSGALRLTANAANQAGWAWRSGQVDLSLGFTTAFSFRITPPAFGQKAEGLAFVVHDDPDGPATAGSSAWGLGYGVGASGDAGIRRSLAVEVDTYRDLWLGDTSDNELSVHTRGAAGNREDEWFALARTTPATDLADGAVHTIELRYALPGTLELFVDGAAAPALSCPWHHETGGTWLSGPAVAGVTDGPAWVGFGATTGAGALTEVVEILSWSWASVSPRHPCYEGSLTSGTLRVEGQEGGSWRTVRLATYQSFGITLYSPPLFGAGAPYALLLSLAPSPGAPGTWLGFGEACVPVLPPGPAALVLASTFGLLPGVLPAQPTPHTIALPAGTVPIPLDFTLQAVTVASAAPLSLGVTNAIDVEFRPVPAPSITALAPLSAAPGQPMTLTGQGFVPGVVLDIGGVPFAPTSTTPTALVFPFPAGAPCASTLTVTNPDGQSASAPFNPLPAVINTVFATGPAAGGSTFYVVGTGFAPGTTVTVGGAPAVVLSVSPGPPTTSLTVVAPPGVPGFAPVVMTTPGGCTASTIYTYL